MMSRSAIWLNMSICSKGLGARRFYRNTGEYTMFMARRKPYTEIFTALNLINTIKSKTDPAISSNKEWNTGASTAWRASLLYILSLSNPCEIEKQDPTTIKDTLVSILAYPFMIKPTETAIDDEIRSWFDESTIETETAAQSYINKNHELARTFHNKSEANPKLIDTDEYAFMKDVEALTSMYRFQSQSYWSDYEIARIDTVSEHSWALALSIYILDRYGLISLDCSELVQLMILSIIHDIEESKTTDKCPIGNEHGNDTHAFNDQKRKEKDDEARKAVIAISESLPIEKRIWIQTLFNETLDCTNPNIILLKAIDTLEACFQIKTMINWKMVQNHLTWSIKYTMTRSKYASNKVRGFVQYCLRRFTKTAKLNTIIQ